MGWCVLARCSWSTVVCVRDQPSSDCRAVSRRCSSVRNLLCHKSFDDTLSPPATQTCNGRRAQRISLQEEKISLNCSFPLCNPWNAEREGGKKSKLKRQKRKIEGRISLLSSSTRLVHCRGRRRRTRGGGWRGAKHDIQKSPPVGAPVRSRHGHAHAPTVDARQNPLCA